MGNRRQKLVSPGKIWFWTLGFYQGSGTGTENKRGVRMEHKSCDLWTIYTFLWTEQKRATNGMVEN